MDRQFKPGDIVQHFKREFVEDKTTNDYLYKIIGFAKHTETGEELVAYKPLYQNDYFNGVDFVVRPAKMFYSEVECNKYHNIKQKFCFELYNK